MERAERTPDDGENFQYPAGAVTGMDNLIESLQAGLGQNQREAAKKRVLNILVKEKPLGNWEDVHRERTDADACRF